MSLRKAWIAAIVGVSGLTYCPALLGQPTVAAPVVSPAAVAVARPTQVTVTASIAAGSTPVIASSVFLYRLNANNVPIANLGTMRDDGLNGDAMAGDSVFTLAVNINETAVGVIPLQVSAAFRGVLRRALSPLVNLPVQTIAPEVAAADSTLTALADEVARGDISAALKRFTQSPLNAETLNGWDTVQRARFADVMRSARLLSGNAVQRIYQVAWRHADGSTRMVKFTVVRTGAEQWTVSSW